MTRASEVALGDDVFDRQLKQFREQIGMSQTLLRQAPVPYRELLMEAFASADLSLEELQVAEHELRQQNDALQTSHLKITHERERYRRLFEFAPDGYVVTDEFGAITEANRAASIMFGLAANFLTHKPLASFVAPPQRRAFRIDMLSLKQIDFLPDLEVAVEPRNGEPFVASFTASVERNQAGDIVHIRWLIRDISERKRWHDRLLGAYTELEQRVDERTVELKEAYARERKIAGVLQERLLEPIRIDAIEGIRIGTRYQPAGHEMLVGGDFYDAYKRSDGAIALAVGDVSGKGLEAASRTAEIKYTLRGLMIGSVSAGDAIRALNVHICNSPRDDKDGEFFVTLCLVILDPVTGRGSVIAAGSERPVVMRANGELEALDLSGLPLGVFDEAVHVEHPIQLGTGDRLVMLTDGVTEARNEHDLLGTDRLLDLVAESSTDGVATAVERIVAGAIAFAGSSLHDDVCVLMVDKT